jgi:hypothetical protein
VPRAHPDQSVNPFERNCNVLRKRSGHDDTPALQRLDRSWRANVPPGLKNRYQRKVTIVTLRKYCHVFYRRGNNSNTARNELCRSHVADRTTYIIKHSTLSSYPW